MEGRRLNSMWILLGVFLLTSCNSTRPLGEYNDGIGDPVVIYGDRFAVVRNPLRLADFLNRVPGVQVLSNKVVIRGQSPPLFVIDGVQVGHDYIDVARTINVFDIESVEVIRDLSQTIQYGARAANGVIIIRTWMPDMSEDEDVMIE